MAQKRRKNRKSFVATAAAIAILLFGLGAGTGAVISHVGRSAAEATEATIPSETTTEEPVTLGSTSVRMMCAGDNLIHSAIYKQAKSRATDGTYDFSYAYEQVKGILAKSDFAVLNQETVLDSSKLPSSYPLFNSPTQLGDLMVDLGFTVINHANNHVLDQGVSGAKATIDYWKNKPAVTLTGLYADEADMNEVKTNTSNEITFAHVGFTQYLNGLTIPSSSTLKVVSPVGAGMTEEEFYATMKQMIQKAKAASDVVCVSMHFQEENITKPNASQEKIIDALVEYGADIIIGTGPHVLQPMKFVEREDGSRVLVFYSLGNFISTQASATNLVSGIGDVTITKDLDTGKIEITDAKLIPIVTYYGVSTSKVHIVPFCNYTSELASTHKLSALSRDYAGKVLNDIIGEQFLELDASTYTPVTETTTKPPVTTAAETSSQIGNHDNLQDAA